MGRRLSSLLLATQCKTSRFVQNQLWSNSALSLALPQADPEKQKSCLYQGCPETSYSGGQGGFKGGNRLGLGTETQLGWTVLL